MNLAALEARAGSADDQAAAALERLELPVTPAPTPPPPEGILALCVVCGWGALAPLGLCLACAEIREWSRVNRAFCALFRGAPEPAAPPAVSADTRAQPEPSGCP
jgi:hypothetical protein